MPKVKNKYLRYETIDDCLRNSANKFPSKEHLRRQCEERIYGTFHESHICISSIEKDIFDMRLEHDAPIKYSRLNDGYYYSGAFILDLTSDKRLKTCISDIVEILELYPARELERRIKLKIDKLT